MNLDVWWTTGSYVGAAWGMWTLLPDVWWRQLRRQVRWRGPVGTGWVVLTFDDGPDPRYTPKVLEILLQEGVQASFFLVGKMAIRYPDLVREIQAAGHDIGNHGFSHRHAWLLGPRGMAREIWLGQQVLADITGKPPVFFRPPWGSFNLSTYHLAKRAGEVVLWSSSAKDWWKQVPGSIARRVVTRAIDGDIILLHDSGGQPGAPACMLAALPSIIRQLRCKGLEPVSLSRLFLAS